MKVRASVTLSGRLVEQLDKLVGPRGNRSAAIEEAVREYLASRARRRREAADLEILNERAHELNDEARDVLTYQVDR